MLLRVSFTGPLNALILCTHPIKWVIHARLSGVTVYNKLTWSQHIFEVKKKFVDKLKSLKRSSYLPRNKLLNLYFKLILPSVSSALPIWESFTNKDRFLALESLHCRAAKLIYSRDMPAVEVYKIVKWDSLHLRTKLSWQYEHIRSFMIVLLRPPSMGHISTYELRVR